MKCVIIDDEPRAIAVLQRYVEKIPGLELLAAFDRPLEAIQFLEDNKPDCLFLDINMPDINGLQLSGLLKNIAVVFTTAYPQFALESYEVSAVDYLLKPVAFPRFLKAVEKLRIALTVIQRPITHANSDNAIFIKSSTKIYRVLINNIIYVETLGNNIIYHTGDMKISSRLTINELFKILSKDKFIQVHKSFIVAKNEIQIIESHQLTTKSGIRLPIGSTYSGDLKKFFLNSQIPNL